MQDIPTPQFVRHLYTTLSRDRIVGDEDEQTSAALAWDTKAPGRFVVHETPALLELIVATPRGGFGCKTHARYLAAMHTITRGAKNWSWKEVAEIVGTRSARQVMTHHQKYRAKLQRMQVNQGVDTSASSSQTDVSCYVGDQEFDRQERTADFMNILLLASAAISAQNAMNEGG
ncbi:hypothetical protein ATCC90586_007376 [Pythium insidiosum]|nr:hypothetical protein ATCC90586_007376 [Pythium insidiosum]